MTKQHKKSRTKASDHRVTQKAKEDHRSPAAATLVDFEKICSEASKKTLEKMCNNPMYKLFGDNRMEVLARFCSDTDFLDAFFLNKLKDIFSLSLCDSSERELFFSRIHELRLSSCVQSECVNLFSEKGCEEKREDIINFLQDYILEIPSEILGGLLKENKKVSEELSYQISTNDQTILFYISGFIVANLRKKCYRMSKENRSERLNLLDKLTSKTSSTNFENRPISQDLVTCEISADFHSSVLELPIPLVYRSLLYLLTV
ncbi:uncharacterized protein LOC134279986 [Saccostrea cucullata]|uniref:uncharacterized protein LOC134253994 n=1 Tax=Saccostrea cuccullata TaxID=36930 RepID=UPI002ED5691C